MINKTMDKYYKFRNSISKTYSKNQVERTKIMRDLYHEEKKQFDIKLEKTIMELEVKQENRASTKNLIYALVSVIATVISVCLSVFGLTGANTFDQLFSSAPRIVIFSLMAFTSVTVWITSFQAEYLKKNYFKQYSKLVMVQVATVIVSIVSNYIFLIRYTNANTLFDYFYLMTFSIILDLIGLSYSSTSQAVKYRNRNFANEISEQLSIFEMVKFLSTYRLKVWLKTTYDKCLEPYKNVFGIVSNRDEKPFQTETKNDEKSRNEKIDVLPDYTNVSDDVSFGEFRFKCEPATIEKDVSKQVIVETKPKRKHETKTEPKRNDNTYEKLVREIKPIKSGTMVSLKQIKTRMTDAEWRRYRDRLVKENLLETKNSRTYRR